MSERINLNWFIRFLMFIQERLIIAHEMGNYFG